MRALLALLALLAAAALASAVPARPARPARPRYIDCVHSDECGLWECCVLGAGRFSLPKCTPMADVGDACGRAAVANTTVAYPDGQRVHFPAVYLGACPCLAGLRCEPEAAACASPVEYALDNTI